MRRKCSLFRCRSQLTRNALRRIQSPWMSRVLQLLPRISLSLVNGLNDRWLRNLKIVAAGANYTY
jgi:hypothetical protein